MDDISDYGQRGVMEIIVSQEKSIPILKGPKFLNSCQYDHNFKVEINFNNYRYALFKQKSAS